MLAAAIGLTATATAYATEGGVGRPITGEQITPYAGIVPPTSDWIVIPIPIRLPPQFRTTFSLEIVTAARIAIMVAPIQAYRQGQLPF